MKLFVFKQALAVRPVGCPDEKAAVFLFSTKLPKGEFTLFLGGHSVYRLRINGRMSGYGPARAAHGYSRIDQFDLCLTKADNTLEIELLHESRPTYFIPQGPLFLIAEIVDSQGNILRATGRNGDFKCRRNPWRYWVGCEHSDQRFSMECYDFTHQAPLDELQLEIAEKLQYIHRDAPMPEWDNILPAEFCGKSIVGEQPEPLHKMCVKRYEPDFDPQFIASNWRFNGVKTGFLKFHFKAVKDVLFHIVYGELMPEEGILNHNVWWGNYIIPIKMAAGEEMEFECFDLHTLQFCSVISAPDSLEVSNCALREYVFPKTLIKNPHPENPLAQAAEETFRQCTVDVFSDCPDRERAAWLCDSFFNARTAYCLTGNTQIEEAFLDNFMVSPEIISHGHSGLMPMCYPADTTDCIPQWSLWLLLELDEYLKKRNGKIDYPHLYQQRLMQILEWFEVYRNDDGLLENIPGWNFIDCSEASNFAEGVNYPTNLLYAKVLDAVASWYQMPHRHKEAENIRQLVKQRGLLNGRLRDSDRFDAASEAAQYYALYFAPDEFKDISLETAADTPYQCGLLMAKMMRYELLFNAGKLAELHGELERDLMPSAERTGTFWEKLYSAKPWVEQTSCCHCFASAILQYL